MEPLQHRFEISLPTGWQQQLPATPLRNDIDKMRYVIELGQWNIKHKTGGPFASAVFCRDTDALISIGVNRVVPANCSLAHAEAVAIALAQQQLSTHDLSAAGSGRYELFASGQPCVQCFGMVWWSGITRLAIGARSEDIEELTPFQEGPLPAAWQHQLASRSGQPAVQVVTDIEREAARTLLANYTASGGANYGPSK